MFARENSHKFKLVHHNYSSLVARYETEEIEEWIMKINYFKITSSIFFFSVIMVYIRKNMHKITNRKLWG